MRVYRKESDEKDKEILCEKYEWCHTLDMLRTLLSKGIFIFQIIQINKGNRVQLLLKTYIILSIYLTICII